MLYLPSQVGADVKDVDAIGITQIVDPTRERKTASVERQTRSGEASVCRVEVDCLASLTVSVDHKRATDVGHRRAGHGIVPITIKVEVVRKTTFCLQVKKIVVIVAHY